MRRKVKIIVLIIIAMAMLACGCGAAGKDDIAMGRYMEEQIALPQVKSYGTTVTGLGIGRDNKLELYEVSESSSRYTRNEDGSWNKEPVEWLNGLHEKDIVSEALLVHGPDNTEYAMIAGRQEDGDSKASLYRREAEGTVSRVDIDTFSEYDINGNWRDYYIPKNMYVLEDGGILIGYMNGAVLYDSEGRIRMDYGVESGCNLTVSGTRVYILNMDMNQVLVYDIESGVLLNSINVTNRGYDRAGRSLIRLFTGQEGEIYLQNREGIHRLSEGGSLWETVVDGTLTSMASPNIDWYMAYQDAGGSFFFIGWREGYHMYQYTYHPEMPAIPSVELTIYSLHKSKTITEAALKFQSMYADVRVSYHAVMMEETSGLEADYIQALNTELLAKKASDIIVLDGLDIDSYIEKGALEDITDILEPLTASQSVYEKVIRAYEREGRILAVPISMNIPVVMGTNAAVASSDTLEKLTQYVTAQTSRSVFGDIDGRDLIQLLYERYSAELYDEEGRLDPEALTGFFERVGLIYERTVRFKDYGLADCTGEPGVLNGVAEINLDSYWNSTDIAACMQIASETGGTWSVFGQQFEPGITVGVNALGARKELAKEFVKLLFTEEIQDNWYYEGLPVRRDCVINNMLAYEEDSDRIMTYGFSFHGEFSMYEVMAPNPESLVNFQEMLEELTLPVILDKEIKNKVVAVTGKLMEGSISMQEAAEAVTNFIKLYHQE